MDIINQHSYWSTDNIDNLSPDEKQWMMDTAAGNALSAIKKKMYSTMEEIRVYEQVIVTCDRIMNGNYKETNQAKDVN